MRAWLILATENAVVVIDAIALVIIVFGTIEAFLTSVRAVLSTPDGPHRRDIWLRYSRWLVAGLTFQLAADIVETSVTSDWQAVGRIGAIAVIRTFLNHFLERDIEDVRRRQQAGGHAREA